MKEVIFVLISTGALVVGGMWFGKKIIDGQESATIHWCYTVGTDPKLNCEYLTLKEYREKRRRLFGDIQEHF